MTDPIHSPSPDLCGILEAILLVAGQPLSLERLCSLCRQTEQPILADDMRHALAELAQSYQERSYELVQVASGWRLQIRPLYNDWVGRLEEIPTPRYSRALLETLALIIYRQPVTRGEIEAIRGVAVSSHIIRTLIDRQWVRVVGHKDTPGRPALYATTAQLLDYFNFTKLAQFPPLADVRNLESVAQALEDQLQPPLASVSLSKNTEPTTALTPGHGIKEQAEIAATELLSSLDTLEEKLPKNFNDLLKGHFEDEEEEAKEEKAAEPQDDQHLEDHH